jgi:hypothetical protein
MRLQAAAGTLFSTVRAGCGLGAARKSWSVDKESTDASLDRSSGSRKRTERLCFSLLREGSFRIEHTELLWLFESIDLDRFIYRYKEVNEKNVQSWPCLRDERKTEVKLKNVRIELPTEQGIRPWRFEVGCSTEEFRPSTANPFPIIHSSPLYKATVKAATTTRQSFVNKESLKSVGFEGGGNKKSEFVESARIFRQEKELKDRFFEVFTGNFVSISSLSVRGLKTRVGIEGNSGREAGKLKLKESRSERLKTSEGKRASSRGKVLRMKLMNIGFDFDGRRTGRQIGSKKVMKKSFNFKPLRLGSEPEERIGLKGKSPLTINSITKN